MTYNDADVKLYSLNHSLKSRQSPLCGGFVSVVRLASVNCNGGFVWMFTTTTTTTTTTNDYSDASLKLQGHTYQIDINDGTVVRSQ